MKQRKFFVVSLISICLLTPIAHAEPYKKANAQSESFFNQAPGLTRKDAARQARNATQGKVIAIKPIKKGNAGYSVRLLVEGGRVVTVKVDRDGNVHRN
ncbi:MAG: hypothetical protein GKR90_14815 [Pseudomonadales bacterium]|nr:hypothetical protein [Pseudomonadales bacterium]